MTKQEKIDNKLATWTFLPCILICVPLAGAIAEFIFICIVYGRDAYLRDGLRIVKFKPYTLSTGVIISDNLGTLAWAIFVFVFFGMSCVTLKIAQVLYARVKRHNKSKDRADHPKEY
jgi:hypothetical protein